MVKTIQTLDAITALDGRYRDKVETLSEYVSEKALIHTRFEIEVEYLLALSEIGVIRKLTTQEKDQLAGLIHEFTPEDATHVKEIEEKTRHDVKAVEYILREKLEGTTLEDIAEKAHLFLTSEDINNIAQRLLLTRALSHVIIPSLKNLLLDITDKAEDYKSVPMLARTHGQAAVPSTVGKEFVVFADRLDREIEKLSLIRLTGKLSGAVGNYNSFEIGVPDKTYWKWVEFSTNFVKQFGLSPNPVTTQINTPEDIIECLQGIQRINGVLIDFASDAWRYISDGWFIQRKVDGEVGSSTMPQKVNPIDFENGEGNLHLANDLIKGLADRLPVSRLQRDLRDSTQLRSFGTILGYVVVGVAGISRGLSKVVVNKMAILDALNSDWSILSEAAQVWLRTNEDTKDPYGLLKNLTRGTKMSELDWKNAVKELKVSTGAQKAFLALTPENYIGFAVEITDEAVRRIQQKNKRT